jgi:hypothetical protein
MQKKPLNMPYNDDINATGKKPPFFAGVCG